MQDYYVAKSYQKWTKLTDVFFENNRAYVNVRSPSGTDRKVRAYTPNEYKRLYGETCASPLTPDGEALKPQGPIVKNILGFQEGYIWIFKGDLDNAEYWFERTSECRYHVQFGWYIVSTESIPFDIPSCIQSVKLPWDAVGNEDGTLKTRDQVQQALDSIVYADSPSTFQGEINDRIEREVRLNRIIDLGENHWGTSRMYQFEDIKGNIYTWTTGTNKAWEVGQAMIIRGGVKGHVVYKGVKQTNLTRVSEVKK
jgi:hypothetical protein